MDAGSWETEFEREEEKLTLLFVRPRAPAEFDHFRPSSTICDHFGQRWTIPAMLDDGGKSRAIGKRKRAG